MQPSRYDKTVRLYDLAKGALLRTLYGHTLSVAHTVYNSVGNLVVSAAKDATIRFWDLRSADGWKRPASWWRNSSLPALAEATIGFCSPHSGGANEPVGSLPAALMPLRGMVDAFYTQAPPSACRLSAPRRASSWAS